MPTSPDQGSAERHRTTIYLEEEDLISLDELKAYIRRTQRRRMDRSQLIREAIRDYRDKHMAAPPSERGRQS